MTFVSCEIKNCVGIVFSVAGSYLICYGCYFHNNADLVISIAVTSFTLECNDCIFYNNAGTSVISLTSATASNIYTIHNCLFVSNTGDGIAQAATSGVPAWELLNCIFYGNGGYGINNSDGAIPTDTGNYTNRYNAYGSNTSGDSNAYILGVNKVTLTADPFVDKANGNFNLNWATGGGLLLRQHGFPGVLISNISNKKDIGIQNLDFSPRTRYIRGM